VRTAAIDAACGRFEATLAGHLAPALALRDTRVTTDPHGWRVRLRADSPDGPLELSIAPPRAPGERLTWSLAGGSGALREALGAPLGADAVADGVGSLRDAVARGEPRRAPLEARWLGEDGPPLAPWIDAYARAYGVALEAVWLEGDETPSVGLPAALDDQAVLLHAPPSFREDARMIAYLEDLGFAVDARDRVSVVPLPRGFARRYARLIAARPPPARDRREGRSPREPGAHRPALVPELRRVRAKVFSPRDWLRAVAGGVLPINVHGAISHLVATARRAPLPRSVTASMDDHLHALGHDVGVHALALHRVPPRRMAALRRLARVALGRGRATAAASFFEERLTRACTELWASARRPEDFEAAYESVHDELATELAREVYR